MQTAFQNLMVEHSVEGVPASLYNLTKSVPDPLNECRLECYDLSYLYPYWSGGVGYELHLGLPMSVPSSWHPVLFSVSAMVTQLILVLHIERLDEIQNTENFQDSWWPNYEDPIGVH